MEQFKRITLVSFKFLLVMTILLGGVYTLSIVGIGQLLFNSAANGSQVEVHLKDGTVKQFGSELIGQEFTKKEYFIGRPMDVSNLSPGSEEHTKLVGERVAWWRSFDALNTADIPADLVMASGSAVDPYISVEAAHFQVARVSKERNMSVTEVQQLVDQVTENPTFGIFGEKRVHVLKLNLLLDGYEI